MTFGYTEFHLPLFFASLQGVEIVLELLTFCKVLLVE